MLIGYVSDENYAALADVAVEFVDSQEVRVVVHSTPSGTILADIPPGPHEVILAKTGFSSKRVSIVVEDGRPVHFRMLSDRMLGYAWPKWCRAGDQVEWRVHATSEYKLGLWRYGFEKQFIRNIGWYDNHGPRVNAQQLPDGHFVETGVRWDAGHGAIHSQTVAAPSQSGLYYFHARTRCSEFCSFPLVIAPAEPTAKIAVLASTNTWNAYNPFGGRSNYLMAGRMLDEPVVNAKSDLPRYRLREYGEWDAEQFAPISFDRPEPFNQVTEIEQCTDKIEGRMECALAPAEWRLLGWLEREGFAYDLYSDYQLHSDELELDRYKVLVLSVHPEYWSVEMYRRVKQWVFQRGGKLAYLGGNGINCAVEYLDDGASMRCLNHWDHRLESRFHTHHESEANLLGVVYSDPGAMTVAPYEVVDPVHWTFSGTGLCRRDLFGVQTLHERYGDGASGHETDKISASSPANVTLLAKGCNADDGGAQMVYFATQSGGEVFSAGSITFASALLCDEACSRITSNVIERFLG